MSCLVHSEKRRSAHAWELRAYEGSKKRYGYKSVQALVVAGLAVFFAACGTSKPSVESPVPTQREAPSDACAIFTPKEIGTYLGVEIGPPVPVPQEAGRPTLCVYNEKAPPKNSVLAIAYARTNADAEFSRWVKSAGSSGQVVDVSGIGDRAAWDVESGTLVALQGETFITVGPLDEDQREVAETIAREALGRS